MKKLMKILVEFGAWPIGNLSFSQGFRGCLLLIFLYGCSVLQANVGSSPIHKTDSLSQCLSKIKRADQKIAILRSLALLNKNKPEEISYLRQMFEVANQADSIPCTYEAIAGIARWYSNENHLDSLSQWVNYLDSLTNIRNVIPNELLIVHNSLCRCYLVNNEYALAMNEAVKQQILAEKSDFKFGSIYSDENFGLVYLATKRFEEAASAFESCMDSLKKIGNKADYELRIAEYLARTYLSIPEYEKAGSTLDYYAHTLDRIEVNDKSDFSKKARSILLIYQIQLYSKTEEPEKARKAVESLPPYLEYISDPNIAPAYYYAMASYYCMRKDYNEALRYINEYTGINNDVLDLKISILRTLGKKEEALKVFQQELKNTKDRNRTAYLRQIDQLQTIQALNEQDQNTQNIYRQRQQLRSQEKQTWILSVFAIVLLAALMVLIRYLVHTKKLKNALFIEKSSLKNTHEKLGIAKKKAENAERMKTNFVANISHEIRTPLNAIVGFSALLDDSEPDERTEYIAVINNNSDLLLKLVSDVLDLSQIETDDFSLNFETTQIYACCQDALNTLRHKVAPSVKLTFTHPETSFQMETDPLRLRQLLVNLLANAVKFTDEGEINLDYRVNHEAKEVVFTVTDTGCGIPLDKQQIIFNRFEKVNDFKQGVGLGLSICMSISKRFQGKLSVDPTYKEGARFIFILPITE